MQQQIRFLFRFAGATRSSLRRHYGRPWPWALLRCFRQGRRLVLATQWADRSDSEADHVRALALLPALYLDLRSRLGAGARDAMRDMVTAFVEAEQTRVARETGLFEIPDPRERWHAFFERAVAQGMGAFNENECLSVEPGRFHLRVVRCVLAELGGEAGVPDLAPMVCDVELAFSRKLLPHYEVTRGSADRNTIARGHACCEYVWKGGPTATADADQEAARPALGAEQEPAPADAPAAASEEAPGQ